MPAMPNPNAPRRTRSMYDEVMEQMKTIEERAPDNIRRIKRTIGLYERIYGMTAAEMHEKLETGEVKETYDICAWLQEVSLLEHILDERQ